MMRICKAEWDFAKNKGKVFAVLLRKGIYLPDDWVLGVKEMRIFRFEGTVDSLAEAVRELDQWLTNNS